ncbi:MAG: radical SAM protein [Desulfamplus sp.]|nr:radical SAM protein [Desulfamplus sp.]
MDNGQWAMDRHPMERGHVTSKKKGALNIALVYPNSYGAGMSNLGFQTVYSLFNAHDHVACHRFFLAPPLKNIESRLENIVKSDIKRIKYGFKSIKSDIKSIESGISLSDYDIIAFSVSFENDFLNLISILKDAHIPLRSRDRDESLSSCPLIIAGGVACFLNPEPVAPFMDFFLLGESEEMISRFIAVISCRYIDQNHAHIHPALIPGDGEESPKQAILKEIAKTVKGAYVPSLYQPVYHMAQGRELLLKTENLHDDIPRPEIQRTLDLSHTTTATTIITPDTAFKNTVLIETGRGCPHGCRFCSAGFIYRPARFYPDHIIIKAMDHALAMTDKIGLVGASVSDHPKINTICAAGITNGQKISFSSLRLDNLTDETLLSLVQSGVKTATIAPEAGSERMRRIINKKITEPQILSAVKRIVEHGIHNIKLYFMTGLPFETDGDITEIVELTLKIKQVFLEASRKQKKIGTITLSINPFIPKPSTPFQWAAMEIPAIYKKKVKKIRDGLKREGNIAVNSESPKTAYINALLSMGDRRMSHVLETALDIGWSKALKHPDHIKILPTIHHPMSPDSPLPWDILDTGIKKSFLVREYQQAQNEIISPDCPFDNCSQCGACKR